MQKLVSKYGTAAHLAILAVAPLFLYPFCAAEWTATALIWLSPLAALWVLVEPSRRSNEMLHDARTRVISGVVRDPLFWMLAFVVVMSAVRWANGGIGLAYEAEKGVWYMRTPAAGFLPGCVDGHGRLQFATALALLVVVMGCRHALGKTARVSFLFAASSLAGLAGIVAAVAFYTGHEGVVRAAKCAMTDPSYYGVAFGMHLLGGVVALVGAFECRWNKYLILFAFAIGGTSAGLYFFSPTYVVVVFLAAALLQLVASCGCEAFKLGGSVPMKCIAAVIIASLIPVLCAMGLASDEFNAIRLAPFGENGSFFDSTFREMRETLSGIAAKVCRDRPWLGSGLGSFPLDIRFNATEADWAVLKPSQTAPLHGWWYLVAERGIVGAISFALIAGTMLFTYVRRLVGSFGRSAFLPGCILGPVAAAALVTITFADVSFLRSEVLLAAGAFFALAASSFPAPVAKDKN